MSPREPNAASPMIRSDGLNRRRFLTVLGTASAVGVCGSPKDLAAADGLEQAAFAAWLYVVPLIEMAGVRSRPRLDGQPAVINTITHSRDLAGPLARNVT